MLYFILITLKVRSSNIDVRRYASTGEAHSFTKLLRG